MILEVGEFSNRNALKSLDLYILRSILMHIFDCDRAIFHGNYLKKEPCKLDVLLRLCFTSMNVFILRIFGYEKLQYAHNAKVYKYLK